MVKQTCTNKHTHIKQNCKSRLVLPDIQKYYESYTIKRIGFWCMNKQIDYWNSIESPKIIPNKDEKFGIIKVASQTTGTKIDYLINYCGTNG